MLLAVVLFFILVTTISAQDGGQTNNTEYRIVGYYSSWSIYGHQYFVTDIPAGKLTHINYAFFDISQDGECALGDELADVQFRYPGDPENLPLYGNIRQLNLLRETNPDLKIMMSIGGLTWSSGFSDVALTDDSRQSFVLSCVEMMARYGFDGIDVDWEFPVSGGLGGGRPEDKGNFTLLLAEFRRWPLLFADDCCPRA